MENETKNETLRGKNETKPDKNTETINEEIMKGEVQGLKQDEIIDNIRNCGIKISRAQYYRYKDKLFVLNQDRLRNMPNEFASQYLKRIATYKLAEKVLWEMFNHESDMKPEAKLSSIKQITDLQEKIQYFYNASPIVNGMMEAIKNANTTTRVLGTSP